MDVACIAVRMGPGVIELQRIPCLLNSLARSLVRILSEPLLTE